MVEQKYCGSRDTAFVVGMQYVNKLHREWYRMKLLNRGRHALLEPNVNKNNPRYYLVFKREWLMTFNYQFPDFVASNPSYKGIGQSINVECLRFAMKLKVDYIIVIMGMGEMYKISPALWLKFAEKNRLVRLQDKTYEYHVPYTNNKEREEVKEATYCVPADLLERLQ